VGVNGLMPNQHPVAETFWFPACHVVGSAMRWWFDRIAYVEYHKRRAAKAPTVVEMTTCPDNHRD